MLIVFLLVILLLAGWMVIRVMLVIGSIFM